MISFINSIPDSFGWACVGFTAALCVVMVGVLVSYAVQYIRDSKNED